MVVKKVWLIPVAAALFGFAAMISGYILGALKGHFPSILPFISDGGAFPPEGCIFSQLLNTGAFFIILTCYIRHRQAIEYYGHRLQWEDSKWRTVSLILMLIGCGMAIGITFVANFPESEVVTIHGIAASLTFILGILYCWGQVLIGFCMIPRMATSLVNYSRLFLCLIATGCMILHEIALIFAPFGKKDPNIGYHIQWWKSDSPYFLNHLVASASEWIMVSSVLLIFLSFSAELRFAYAHSPKIVFRRTLEELDHHIKIDQIPTTSGIQRSSDW